MQKTINVHRGNGDYLTTLPGDATEWSAAKSGTIFSEMNKIFDRITGTWPEFTSSDDNFFENEESLQLNFTETDDVVMLEAELSGFRPVDVNVSFLNQSMIIEACCGEVQSKSYYLGEYSEPSCRWTIPLGCAIEKDTIKKQFKDDTLFVSVLKPVDVTRLVAFESE